MDRLNDQDVDPDGKIAWHQANELAGARDRGEDDDLNERIDAEGNPTTDASGILVDRRDREHVAYYQDSQGRWRPMRVKVGDDVVCSGLVFRVIGAGRGREQLLGYNASQYGDSTLPIEAKHITERAPVDPNDTPAMPVIPEESSP